ncbi:hypothetical protein ACKVMT_02190 [Halobacteriales archaeon Cl-PHB]
MFNWEAALEIPVGKLVAMVVDEFQEWSYLFPVWSFADFLRISVPQNKPHLFEFREVVVDKLGLKHLRLLPLGNTIQRVTVVIVLWIMVQQRDE